MVFKAFGAFQPLLLGSVVQVVTNNMTMMYYINKQGGNHAVGLLLLSVHFWEWCLEDRIFPVAIHLAG